MPGSLTVGIVIYGDPNQLSGGYLYDRKMADYLSRQGCVVHFLSISPHRYYSSIVSSPFAELGEQIPSAEAFDFIIVDELVHPSVAFRLERIRNLFGCPILLLVHHLRSNERVSLVNKVIATALEKNVVRHVDGHIFNSTSTAYEVSRLGRSDLNRTGVIAPPAGDRLTSAGPGKNPSTIGADGGISILFVGNIIPRKGLHVLLKALRHLCANDREIGPVSLTIVGDDRSFPRYVRRVVTMATRSAQLFSTKFLGRVDDGPLARLYADHHVLCVPSSFEGFGIVYLEGMHFGLPAIGTTMGGASDVIVHEKNGFLLPSGRWQPISEALIKLIQSPEVYSQMRNAALQTAAEALTWDASMARIYSYLTNLHNNSNLRHNGR